MNLKPAAMYNRHHEVPQLDSWPGQVDAHYFNHVQGALKHFGNEIRLDLPGLKHLDLILQKDAWIMIDRTLNDYPIATWCEFQSDHRDNLHEPVKCRMLSFHYAARMVMSRTLEAMEKYVIEELNKLAPEVSHDVIPFKKNPQQNTD